MNDSYRSEPLFPYASEFYIVFPKGFKRDLGEGSIYETDNYILYFKPNTPEDIKERLIKDYAEYYKEQSVFIN